MKAKIVVILSLLLVTASFSFAQDGENSSGESLSEKVCEFAKDLHEMVDEGPTTRFVNDLAGDPAGKLEEAACKDAETSEGKNEDE